MGCPWIKNNSASAGAEAEKLTAKAKRFAGRVKQALSDSPKVIQAFLVNHTLTCHTGLLRTLASGGQKPTPRIPLAINDK